ncbi:MAG: hypothetical protein AAFX39_03940 [Pseudomonadota bacterium]
MIEWSLLFALGFFSACMIGVLALPMIWNRATAVAQRRIEATIPVTVAEMNADKDQLRAEFAMSMSRLESNLDKLKEKASTRLVELGKRDEAVQSLRAQVLAQKRASSDLRDEIDTHKKTIRKLEADLEATRLGLETATTVPGQTTDSQDAERDHYMSLADGRRIEIAALKTQIATLTGKLEDFGLSREDAEKAAGGRLPSPNAEDAATRANAASAPTNGGGRQDAEVKRLTKALKDAEATARKFEVAAHDKEAERLTMDAEMRALRTEIAALRATRETDWEVERQENAMMRERLNDLAAEVAKVAFALEEDDELRDLAKRTAEAADEDDATGAGASPLADRIRALQVRLSENA